jgi:hypothetical protein
MSWAAVIAGGAAIIGGVVSSQGSKKAAKQSAAGSDAAINEAARQFDTIQRNTATGRAIGDQALNALGSIYGYKSAGQYYGAASPLASATQFTAPSIENDGFFNKGAGSILNPWTVTSKLGTAGKILDPAGGLLGNLFGKKHGDEKRNLKAFAAESGVMQLENGMLMLPDGSTFSPDQLQHVAGTWYGAVHAPDGNQEDWQNRYNTLLGGLQKTPLPSAGGEFASSGASSSPVEGSGSPQTAPDYSAFFKSPDYTFRRDEGTRGIERTAAARGGAFSGNALKALNEFNSNLAAGEFGNYFNRQAALAGIGQAATAQTNQAGLYTGSMVGNALQNQGDARASGIVGQYNAYGNALSGVGQAAGYYFGNRNSGDPSGIGYFKPTARRV